MVELTDIDGKAIYVSPTQVVAVQAGLGGASIELPSGRLLLVKHSVPDVLKKLGQAARIGWRRWELLGA